MDYLGFQERLDQTGELVVPFGRHSPLAPLFVGSQSGISQASPRDGIDVRFCRTAFLPGVERGRIRDDQFSDLGFRTLGGDDHCHLWMPFGDRWSAGPPGGWAAVNHLRVSPVVFLQGGTDWHGVAVCGIQKPVGHASPDPWCLYSESGRLILALRVTEGVRKFDVATVATSELDCDWEVDFEAGTVLCSLGGVTVLDEPLVPGTRLACDYVHGFSVGSLRPFAGDVGHFGGWNRDVVVTDLIVRYNRDSLSPCVIYPRDGRVPTYTGGPSLPLVKQQPGGWARAVPVENSGFRVSDVTFSGVRIESNGFAPLVSLGWVEGGVTFSGCRLTGGSVGILSETSGVQYPVRILGDTVISGQADSCVHLLRATMGSVIRDSQVKLAKRCSVHAVGCELLIDAVTEHPDVDHATACVVIDGGRQVRIQNYFSDWEIDEENLPPGFAAVKIRPASYDTGFPTSVVLDGVSFRANPDFEPDPLLWSLLPPQAGYAAATRVVVDGERVVW